jgi:hypothetical protein
MLKSCIWPIIGCFLLVSRAEISSATQIKISHWLGAQSTYIWRAQSSVWRLPNYWPPTPSPPCEFVLPPHHKAGGTHSPGGEGVWVNISEDARHWIGLLQYNPSTARRIHILHVREQRPYKYHHLPFPSQSFNLWLGNYTPLQLVAGKKHQLCYCTVIRRVFALIRENTFIPYKATAKLKKQPCLLFVLRYKQPGLEAQTISWDIPLIYCKKGYWTYYLLSTLSSIRLNMLASLG